MKRSRIAGSEVTIVDVAREAGVSHATVSRVINQSSYVDPDKQERVIRAMSRLGYVPNLQARSLAGGRSMVVGLLASDLTNPYVGLIYSGIEEELAKSQYDLMLYTTQRRRTKEAAHVATISNGLADGLLIILPRNAEAYKGALQQRHFPHVLIDYEGDGLTSSVSTDHQHGAEAVMRYLIGLGHRRIGLITGKDLYAAYVRIEAYKAMLAEANILIEPELIQEGDFFQPSGYEKTHVLLSQSPPPTAIVASSDPMALGAYEAARERGILIPDQLSIVGFNDIPQAAYMRPGLTTLKLPLEAMGSAAARMLIALIADPALAPQRVELQSELVIRDSACPPR